MNETLGHWLIGIGLAFDLLGCVGLVRLPDVYNRVQAATKCVTLGTCMILVGTFAIAGGGAMGTSALGAYRSGVHLWEGSVVDRYREDLHAAKPPAERAEPEAAREHGRQGATTTCINRRDTWRRSDAACRARSRPKPGRPSEIGSKEAAR
jgi:multicomponent Na+:H+ antiporter subunit G